MLVGASMFLFDTTMLYNFEMCSLLCWQDFEDNFPPGPDSMEQLFDWRNYNAKVLMSDQSNRNSFARLLLDVNRIALHEDFAGPAELHWRSSSMR